MYLLCEELSTIGVASYCSERGYSVCHRKPTEAMQADYGDGTQAMLSVIWNKAHSGEYAG
jgi:hypothetical protein